MATRTQLMAELLAGMTLISNKQNEPATRAEYMERISKVGKYVEDIAASIPHAKIRDENGDGDKVVSRDLGDLLTAYQIVVVALMGESATCDSCGEIDAAIFSVVHNTLSTQTLAMSKHVLTIHTDVYADEDKPIAAHTH